MIKVVIISQKDFSGSGYKLATALRCNGVDARVITEERSSHHYSVDYCVETTNKSFLQELIDKADIVHYKGDDVPQQRWNGLDLSGKRTIITVAGSGFRRHGDLIVRKTFAELSEYKTHVKTAFTPDLIYENEWIYTPQTICGNEFLFKKGKIIIQHSPSARAKKGTDDYIIPAIELLKQKYDFEFELLEGLSNTECCERKKRGSIFIDQVCTTGWYGISALESMRYGVPTIAHLSNEAVKNSGLKDIAVINAELSIEGVYNAVESILKGNIEKLAEKTYQYFMDVHSGDSVAKRFISIYNDLMKIKVEKKAYNPINIDNMEENVIVRHVRNMAYGGGDKIGTIEVQPKSTAIALATHGIVEIIKNNDMVRIEIKRPINIDGKLRNAGDVIEVNYIKAERLNNNGDAVIIEFNNKPDPLIDNDEKLAEYAKPELPKQDDAEAIEQRVVEPTVTETERKTTPKRTTRKTKTKK